MPLTLVTGPANSEKAGVVLERYRAQLARAPILVVPRTADALHYRRELAQDGVVFGVRVESFAGLMREVAARAGLGLRALGPAAREQVLAAAIEQAPLELLRPSSAVPGFLAAAAKLVAELGARRIEPQRLTAALRSWAPTGYGAEVAAIYATYHRRLERLGRVDEEQLRARSLDALRLDPSRWGSTPVMLYGFDDLDPLQLDTVETLAREVDVVLSLPYEPGRVALAGRATTFETLRPAAVEIVCLPPRAEHYDAEARATLHQLERALFEPQAPQPECGEALGLLEGETERDEFELVAAEIRELLEHGYTNADIAVAMRGVAGAELLEEVFAEYGIATSIVRATRFADTPVGRGLIGLLRAALTDGDAEDLLAWLRSPGLIERPGLVDRFEAKLRRAGVGEARAAAALWTHFPLEAPARLREAAGRGRLLERTTVELERLLAAPWRRRAEVLEASELAQTRAAAQAQRLLAELAGLHPSPAQLISALHRLEHEPAPTPGGVLVCDPSSLRARRVRALFVCGLQEGSFPAAPREEPFFSAQERADLARATGLLLSPFTDALAAERYLFYATTSRAQSRLRLSWHRASDDGAPTPPSPFLADVCDAFGPGLEARCRAGDPEFSEPLRVAVGAAGGRGGALLGHDAVRDRVAAAIPEPAPQPRHWSTARSLSGAAQSPSALEAWVACPAAWFVQRLLRAESLEPDDEARARGLVAHAVLAGVVGQGARAGELVVEALERHVGELSVNEQRDRAARRRLQADLERYLAGRDAAAGHVPREFELSFGLAGSAHPAIGLAGGELVLRGRIDRVDVDAAAGTAIVHDYKSGEVLGAAKWAERGRLALALYMLAAGELLGLEVVGGLYQPLRGTDLRPRGALLEDAEPGLACVSTDRIAAAELAGVLDEALGRAVGAVRELRAGALEARPATCSREGVCRHPTICAGLRQANRGATHR